MFQTWVPTLSLCSICPTKAFRKATGWRAEISNPGWPWQVPKGLFLKNQDPRTPPEGAQPLRETLVQDQELWNKQPRSPVTGHVTLGKDAFLSPSLNFLV